MRWILLSLLFLTACTPQAVSYAQARYPKCRVLYLGTDGAYDKVSISCPDGISKVERYRRR